jgi:hypothetical protein
MAGSTEARDGTSRRRYLGVTLRAGQPSLQIVECIDQFWGLERAISPADAYGPQGAGRHELGDGGIRSLKASPDRLSRGADSHHRERSVAVRTVSMLDRLLHHAAVVVTEGESFRMREAKTRSGLGRAVQAAAQEVPAER